MPNRNNPVAGATYFLRGLSLITQPGIRIYVAIPLLVNIALFSGLIWFGADTLSGFLDQQLPAYLDWLKWLIIPIFVLSVLFVSAFAFNLVANLIAAPFNGLLAEAIERHLTGKVAPGETGFKKVLKELGATLLSELRKLGYIIKWGLPILILVFIPGINVLGSVLWILFSAWMLAVSYIDFPMGNHGLHFNVQREYLRNKRWLSLGFGGAVMFALAVPILNFLVVPWAVAGATLMWVEQFADESKSDRPALPESGSGDETA